MCKGKFGLKFGVVVVKKVVMIVVGILIFVFLSGVKRGRGRSSKSMFIILDGFLNVNFLDIVICFIVEVDLRVIEKVKFECFCVVFMMNLVLRFSYVASSF